MKGIFWNCNGFADTKKYRFLSDLTKEKNLDFIALSETGRANFPQSTLNNINFFGIAWLHGVGLVA